MSEKKERFGSIFPGLEGFDWNSPQRGQVFTVTLRSQGIGIQSKEIATDLDAWEQC